MSGKNLEVLFGRDSATDQIPEQPDIRITGPPPPTPSSTPYLVKLTDEIWQNFEVLFARDVAVEQIVDQTLYNQTSASLTPPPPPPSSSTPYLVKLTGEVWQNLELLFARDMAVEQIADQTLYNQTSASLTPPLPTSIFHPLSGQTYR